MVESIFLIILGKIIVYLSNALNFGNGSTWPGHIALFLNNKFIENIFKESETKVILVVGTNGKTTTGKLIKTILEKNGKRAFQNESGANLLNGIASSLIQGSTLSGKIDFDFAILEIDENSLPLILKKLKPDFVIVLNLFRDQLDRYGEIDSIAKKWKEAFSNLNKNTNVILNADDPLIASIGQDLNAKTYYFGLEAEKTQKTEQIADSIYCPKCSARLTFNNIIFSHLGDWQCLGCGFKRPALQVSKLSFYPLLGIYNKYNTNAAFLFSTIIGINKENILNSLKTFKPAFGRQESLNVKNKNVQIYLSKNPTSFNQSLQTIIDSRAKHILIVLNDRIPDGRDVSWIWDTDIEMLNGKKRDILVSGDRTYDIGLRLKYAGMDFESQENLTKAVDSALDKTSEKETLYILPTYSAMLEVRKILTGKKIL